MRKPDDPSRAEGGAVGIPKDPARRKLLQFGAAGAAAALGSGAVSLLARDQQAPPPAAPAAPAGPPSAAGVIDPAAMTAETWTEPWIWRPADWPGQALDLNVVERNEPNKAPSPGQVFPGQFSFGGISPAPTIRVRGDALFRVRLRNLLGQDFGHMWVGPCPDPLSITPELLLAFQCQVAKAAGKPCPDAPDPTFNVFDHIDELGRFLGVMFMDGHCMTGVSNSEHGSRVTNLHTHGLHVDPGTNAERHRIGQRPRAPAQQGRLGDAQADGRPGVRRAETARTRRPRGLRVQPGPRPARGDAADRPADRSRTRPARTGTTRTRTDPRTIRSPPAWPAS